MSNEDFNFNSDEFDVTKIALEELAKIMIPMFKALMKAGATVSEAAAITVAYSNYWAQNPKADGEE